MSTNASQNSFQYSGDSSTEDESKTIRQEVESTFGDASAAIDKALKATCIEGYAPHVMQLLRGDEPHTLTLRHTASGEEKEVCACFEVCSPTTFVSQHSFSTIQDAWKNGFITVLFDTRKTPESVVIPSVDLQRATLVDFLEEFTNLINGSAANAVR